MNVSQLPDESELLFFDTFSHESSEEINLDLVQFTKTVCITEVRIIPLGARVQADFPGGVRLGATNPSLFEIEFFVNDLSKPGASVFESFGGVEYNQNGNIHLECQQRIPTDGLILRGWYTTITLAVYGYLTKTIIQETPPPGPRAPPDAVGPTANATAEWVQQHAPQVGEIPVTDNPYIVESSRNPYSSSYPEEEYVTPIQHQEYPYQEQWNQDGNTDGAYDPPKEGFEDEIIPWDGRSGGDDKSHWDRNKERDSRMPERDFREQNKDRSPSFEHNRGDFHRGGGGDLYHGSHPSRSSWQNEWSGKRPRSPPLPPPQQGRITSVGARTPPPPVQDDLTSLSPHRSEHGSLKKGSSPIQFETFSPGDVESISEGEIPEADVDGEGEVNATPPPVSSPQQEETMEAEPFEPILSDEEIGDDPDQQFQDLDFDFNEFIDDPLKPFSPYNFEQRQFMYLSDPAISSVLWEEKKINRNTCAGNRVLASKPNFEDNVKQGPENLEAVMVSPESKEEWVRVAEMTTNLLHKNLPYVQDKNSIIERLLTWVDIGLNFEAALSQPQPGFKVRHIKVGVRLVEAIALCGESLVDKLVSVHKVQKKLLDLFHKDYMALSIKLMILKSLDATLRYENSVKQFLETLEGENLSGYQMLLEMLQGKQLARVKLAISSILKKLHTYEVIEKFRNCVIELGELSAEQNVSAMSSLIENISISLEEIVRVYREAPSILCQPKRFLPVSAQFEVGAALGSTDPFQALFTYFRIHKLLESFVFLLTFPGTACDSNIMAPIHELLGVFLQSQDGMKFLASSTTVINHLTKVLLGSSPEGGEEVPSSVPEETTPGSSPQLGLHLVYRLQTLMHIDTLLVQSENTLDPDQDEVLDVLHNLFCLTFTAIGKSSVVHVLSRNDNMSVLIKYMKSNILENDLKLKKSPGKGYIIDLIVLTVKHSDFVPFLQKYSRELLDIIQKDNSLEFNEILPWLKPVENPSAFTYDNISSLCDIVKRNVENATSLPGELVTAVRVLRYLGIPSYDKDLIPSNPDSLDFQELKYKCVILQLFSLEGLTYLIGCLNKINEHYEQPALHAAKLVARQGLALTAFLVPTVQLIRRILTYVIKCRNADFKDLTAIPVLLQTYTLMHTIPVNAHIHTDAHKICRDIIEIFLAYTQPISPETSTESEALNKSLWTLLMAEILKYIISSPFTFLSGLSILSELLPLPLPIQTKSTLTEEEITQAVNCRKLWSAHLHSLNPQLQDLISTMSGSSYHLLLQQLKGVCIQLADLAAPTALTVTRAILDSINSALVALDRPASGHVVQVLNFLAYLLTHASIKATVIYLLTRNPMCAKHDEQYPNIIISLCQILRTPYDIPTHIQAQECIISIIQSLCDTELTLFPPSNGTTVNSAPTDVYLANTLPSRDLLGTLCLAMLDHLIGTKDLKTALPTYTPLIRTLVMLTEHDYGYFHLKNCMEKKSNSIWTCLATLCISWSKDSKAEILSTLSAFIELIHACITPENHSDQTGLPSRTLLASPQEIRVFLNWNTPYQDFKNPLYCLQKLIQDEEKHFDSPLLPDNINSLIKLIEDDNNKSSDAKEISEPVLPPAESLLAQFAARPVFIVADVEDERLSATYYLAPPTVDDQDTEMEQITCDLLEVASVDLPEMNLLERLSILCRHKAAPGDLHAPVPPTCKKRPLAGSAIATDTNAKRLFVAPMRGRGFRGSVQQRGDMFRSRPPNTSRPPSLHVDDFVALETCGQQPTGPTGYNKISMRAAQDMIATRSRGRGRAYGIMERGGHFFTGSGPPYRRDAESSSLWHADGSVVTSVSSAVSGPGLHSYRGEGPPRFPGGRGLRPPHSWDRFPHPRGRHIRFFTRSRDLNHWIRH